MVPGASISVRERCGGNWAQLLLPKRRGKKDLTKEEVGGAT